MCEPSSVIIYLRQINDKYFDLKQNMYSQTNRGVICVMYFNVIKRFSILVSTSNKVCRIIISALL